MQLLFTFIAAIASAAAFAHFIPLARLFEIFQPLIVCISIIIAAILVRLNRGMPTLDWKSLKLEERIRLTTNILNLTKEYLVVIFIASIFFGIILTLLTFGKAEFVAITTSIEQKIVSAGLGFVIVLLWLRMCYIVWRDYDIVKLQKKLIDDSGLKDQVDLEIKSSESRVADIRSAGLRRVANGEIKDWS